MSKYYYHGFKTITDGISILASGGIQSRRMRGLSSSNGFERLDYVCVCTKRDKIAYDDDVNSAFGWFIENQFCFIISPDIPAFDPEYLPEDIFFGAKMAQFLEEHPEGQYTNLFDEMQVKDYIPVSKIVGLGVPVSILNENPYFSTKELLSFKRLLSLADALGLDVIDSSEEDFIENYEYEKEKTKRRISIFEGKE